MKKDFITFTPEYGGGAANVQVTAEPNVTTQQRSTTLNFDANGQQLKSVQVNQLGIPFFANILPSIHSAPVDGSALAFEMRQTTFYDSAPEGEGCSEEDFECLITNYPYNNLSEIEFMVNIACHSNVLGTEFQLYWQYSPDGGNNWITDTFSLESSSGSYEFYTGYTQSFELTQLPDPLQIRIGYGDKGSESVDVWLKKFDVTFTLSPRP